jgi:hypothetical protein
VNPAPVCPRCHSSRHVVRGGRTLQPHSWICLDCWQHIRHLAAAVRYWRLWEEVDKILRKAAT